MKRFVATFLNIFFLSFFNCICFAQGPPDSTHSMPLITVTVLKEAIDPNSLNPDPFILKLNQNFSSTERDGFGNGPEGRATKFKFDQYRTTVFKFIFDNPTLEPLNQATKDSIIALPVQSTITDDLMNPAKDSKDGRCVSTYYLLENYALITDLLWYYADTAYARALRDSLAILAAFAEEVLRETEPTFRRAAINNKCQSPKRKQIPIGNLQNPTPSFGNLHFAV